MKLSRDFGHWYLVLGLLLNLAFVMALGCQSVQQHKKDRTTDRWICPEFADMPLRQGRFEEAIEQHVKVLHQDPDNGLAHYHLGYAYGQLGSFSRILGEIYLEFF